MQRAVQILLLSVFLWGAGLSPATAGFIFTPIDVPGSSGTAARGINDTGEIVGVFSDASFRGHGFLLSGGSFTTIDVPGSNSTQAFGINDTGQIVGTFTDASNTQHGFLLSGGSITTIDVPGSFTSEVYDINNNGQIVGGFRDASGFHGFLFSGGSFTTIDVPGSSSFTAAFGINDTGEIVGVFSDASGFHGFLFSGGSFTTIDVPGSSNSTEARGINDTGEIVGMFFGVGGFHGFLLSGGSFTTIDVPGSNSTQAFGINDTGQIVGTFTDASFRAHGFLATLQEQELVSLAPATLWIGLKNSDDQGTQFDLRAEVYINGDLVAAGLTRCNAGVTRNPNNAKEVAVPFDSITDGAFESGDELSVTILTRIGTNPNDTKCPGHTNAVGLRLYYDAVSRPSGVGAEFTPDPLQDFFLHSGGDDFLDDTAPTATTAKFKDSPS